MRALLIASLLAGSAFAHAATPVQQKLQPITENLSEITALIEQLTPGQATANWENPRIPGIAADRKQAMTDAGCHYTFPEDPAQDSAGLPIGLIEVGGPNCPIEILMNISGTVLAMGLDATIDIHYKLKNRAAFPKDDIGELHTQMKFTGVVQVDEPKGIINMDVTGKFTTDGLSFSQGAFTNNATAKIVLKLTGFNLEMAQSQETVFKVGALNATFKEELKGGFFGAEEHYLIDGKEVAKEDYRKTFSEYKAPFFSTSALGKPKSISACRVEMFPGTTDLAALTAYAETGAPLRVSPFKQVNACGADMERESQWEDQTLRSLFKFGRGYMMIQPKLTSPAGQVPVEPFYGLYDERQSRVDKIGDNYMVFICEPVKVCP